MRDGRLRTFREQKCDMIAEALIVCGSMAAASAALVIPRATFYRWVREHHLGEVLAVTATWRRARGRGRGAGGGL